ncbi:hypothetical protein B0H14DRAFT_3462167 [Mycena olivaceomarginata]|nr:hypothetical protein B0H14DRAFT_3462167 [Mycena olivaceomarginata]
MWIYDSRHGSSFHNYIFLSTDPVPPLRYTTPLGSSRKVLNFQSAPCRRFLPPTVIGTETIHRYRATGIAIYSTAHRFSKQLPVDGHTTLCHLMLRHPPNQVHFRTVLPPRRTWSLRIPRDGFLDPSRCFTAAHGSTALSVALLPRHSSALRMSRDGFLGVTRSSTANPVLLLAISCLYTLAGQVPSLERNSTASIFPCGRPYKRDHTLNDLKIAPRMPRFASGCAVLHEGGLRDEGVAQLRQGVTACESGGCTTATVSGDADETRTAAHGDTGLMSKDGWTGMHPPQRLHPKHPSSAHLSYKSYQEEKDCNEKHPWAACRPRQAANCAKSSTATSWSPQPSAQRGPLFYDADPDDARWTWSKKAATS